MWGGEELTIDGPEETNHLCFENKSILYVRVTCEA